MSLLRGGWRGTGYTISTYLTDGPVLPFVGLGYLRASSAAFVFFPGDFQALGSVRLVPGMPLMRAGGPGQVFLRSTSLTHEPI